MALGSFSFTFERCVQFAKSIWQLSNNIIYVYLHCNCTNLLDVVSRTTGGLSCRTLIGRINRCWSLLAGYPISGVWSLPKKQSITSPPLHPSESSQLPSILVTIIPFISFSSSIRVQLKISTEKTLKTPYLLRVGSVPFLTHTLIAGQRNCPFES